MQTTKIDNSNSIFSCYQLQKKSFQITLKMLASDTDPKSSILRLIWKPFMLFVSDLKKINLCFKTQMSSSVMKNRTAMWA